LNVTRAFLERKDGKFKWFEEKLEQFGIEILSKDDFEDLFNLNEEISKAGGSDFKGLDLIAIDLTERPTKLDEKYILTGIEPWKYSLVYSAMKNYRNSVVIVDSDDFKRVIESIDECGDVTLQDRRMLALKAMYRLLRINSLTHKELSEVFAAEKFETVILEEIIPLRYGENPHQYAHISKIAKEVAFFDFLDEDELFGMSYNNLIDLHLALSTIKNLKSDFVVRVHHGSIVDVVKRAFNFKNARGVLATNFMNDELDRSLQENDLDILAVPKDTKIKAKAKRIVHFDENRLSFTDKQYRFLDGNFLVQTFDDLENMRFSTENDDPQYRWANVVAALSNSMACCIFKDNEMISLGSGQADQIDALETALMRAKRYGKDVQNAVFAFDGPIKDEIVAEKLAEIGSGTVIEPGGSKMDKIVREKLEKSKMNLIFTGKRRYKH
jgi:phosphoribosylaminoimidazolecarboxamide formyltransferase/IMP cyclohydrolase